MGSLRPAPPHVRHPLPSPVLRSPRPLHHHRRLPHQPQDASEYAYNLESEYGAGNWEVGAEQQWSTQ